MPLTVAFILCEFVFACPHLSSADQVAYRRAGEELLEYLSLDSELSDCRLEHEPKPTDWETVHELTIEVYGQTKARRTVRRSEAGFDVEYSDRLGVWRGRVSAERIAPWARKLIFLARSRVVSVSKPEALGTAIWRSGGVLVYVLDHDRQAVAWIRTASFSLHLGEQVTLEAMRFFDDELRPGLTLAPKSANEIAQRMDTLRAASVGEDGIVRDLTRTYLAATQLVNWRYEPALPEIERLGFAHLAAWFRLFKARDPAEPARDLLRWDNALIEFVSAEYPPEERRRVLVHLLESIKPRSYGSPHFDQALRQLRTCDPEGRTIPAVRALHDRSDWLHRTYVRGHLLLWAFDEDDFEALIDQLHHETKGSDRVYPAVVAATMLVRFVEATGRRRARVAGEIWDAVAGREADQTTYDLLSQLVRLELPETQLLVQQFLHSEEEILPLESMAQLDVDVAGRVAREWIRSGIEAQGRFHWLTLAQISCLDDRKTTIQVIDDLLHAMESDRLWMHPWEMHALVSLREFCRANLSDPPPEGHEVIFPKSLKKPLMKQLIAEGADPAWIETLLPPTYPLWMPPPRREPRSR